MVYMQMGIDEGEEVVVDVRTETVAEEAEEAVEEATRSTRTNSERKSRNCSNIIVRCTR